MNRRIFIKQTGAITAFSGIPSVFHFKENSNPLLSAYYFRAHMYTLVPKQVREDMQWMADLGTNYVCPAILEQDLYAGVENLDIIANEAEKAGMGLLGVPSRWGGLIAGAPKVPSYFTITHPDTYMLNKDGSPIESGVSGRLSSYFHPQTIDFFKKKASEIIGKWGLKGLIWDEPKAFNRKDYSAAAISKMGSNATLNEYNQAFADFWSLVNSHVKAQYPEVLLSLFTYASYGNDPDLVSQIVGIDGLDYVGCDGRPWKNTDAGVNESAGKVLLSDEGGLTYLKASKEQGKKVLWLIENHNMEKKDNKLMDKRMPEVLEADVDHLMYYYFPRNLEDPDSNMSILLKHLSQIRQ